MNPISDTIPDIIIENDDIDLGHEAKIGRIPDDDIYYLMSRGLSEEDAKAMLVLRICRTDFKGTSFGICCRNEPPHRS